MEVISDPKKIFNMDESSFCLNPNPGKVLARRGSRKVYNVAKGSDKDCYTVLVGGEMANIFASSDSSCKSLLQHYYIYIYILHIIPY